MRPLITATRVQHTSSTLGAALQDRFQRTRGIGGLDQAVGYVPGGVSAAPPRRASGPDLAASLNSQSHPVGGAGPARGRPGRHRGCRRDLPGAGRRPPGRVPPRPRRVAGQPVAAGWRRWAGARTPWPPAPRPSRSTGSWPPPARRRYRPDLAGSLTNPRPRWRRWAGARTPWPPAPRPSRSTGSWPRPARRRYRPDLAGSLTNRSSGWRRWAGARTPWPPSRGRRDPPGAGRGPPGRVPPRPRRRR